MLVLKTKINKFYTNTKANQSCRHLFDVTCCCIDINDERILVNNNFSDKL